MIAQLFACVSGLLRFFRLSTANVFIQLLNLVLESGDRLLPFLLQHFLVEGLLLFRVILDRA